LSEARYGSDIAKRALAVSEYQSWAFWWQALAATAAFLAAGIAAWFAKLAAEEMKKSADAAVKTLRNERAWLLPGPRLNAVHMGENVRWNGKPFSGERIDIPIANFGKTPAIDVVLFAEQAIIDVDGPIEPTPINLEEHPTYHGIFAPNSIACLPTIYITDAEVVRVRAKTSAAFLFARVEYRDIFEDITRVSEYCFEVYWDGSVIRNGIHVGDMWGYRPIQRYTRVT
jgi:hypothetical protein